MNKIVAFRSHLFSKICFILLFFLANIHCSYSQRFYSVVFSDLPQDAQLFPRNAQNMGTIPISGIVELAGWSYMSVVIKREGVSYGYAKSVLDYTKNSAVGTFNVANAKIKAEAAEYSCAIYACKGQDSVLIVTKEHLVAGDFYVINGQSNAYAFNLGNPVYSYDNKYIRTFGQNSGSEKDTLWTNPSPVVGAWGLALQKLVIENKGIPTCLINGAIPGTNINKHFRDAQNPANLGTIYGNLLYRIKKAKAINNIKCFLWVQGEDDIIENSTTYPQDFTKLYEAWRTDYPKVEQFIVFQSNVLFLPSTTGPAIRNFQRLTPSLFPKIEVFAMNGLETFDGIHHSNAAYYQIAQKIYRLLGTKFYGDSDNPNFHSPSIKKSYFTSSKHDAVTLEFESGQEMIPVADTLVRSQISTDYVTLSLKKYFYFDNDESKTASISNISYQGNKVTLSFSQPITYSKIGYLPFRYYTFEISKFVGPCLKNKNYMNACGFHDVSIDNESINSTLSSPIVSSASASYYHTINLSWNKVALATQYVIERKNDNQSFSVVATLDSSRLSWSNTGLVAGTSYSYRIKAVNNTTSSDYTLVTVSTPALLSTPELTGSLTGLNQVTVTWKSISNATTYRLERKVGTGEFSLIQNYTNATSTYLDKNINYGTTYTYRLTAYSTLSESLPANATISSPKQLEKPSLSGSIINKNTLSITWKKVTGGQTYVLERKTVKIGYTVISQTDSTRLSLTDDKLVENTNYTYRLKVYGKNTESVYDSISIVTPDFLATPVLSLEENVANRSIKVSWKTIANANSYTIERQTAGVDTTYNLVGTSSSLEFIDTKITDNQKYTYRVKATSSISESLFGLKSITTTKILATEKEQPTAFVKAFPNPTQGELTVQFQENSTGILSIIDLKGMSVWLQHFTNRSEINLNLSGLGTGIYFLQIKTSKGNFSEKIMLY
ncbi:MAG: sialate O-acetylesterase [Spirosomataceae bacterium]